MAFEQLYYTSCTTGLSDGPGFQFNAVSPGVDAALRERVESMTAYQPPRDARSGRAATPAEAPVNLCYAPGTDTIVAQVAYLGTDYSNREGNYFAHALVTREPAADLAGVLPIELWEAAFWRRAAVDHTDLPRLPGPPPPGSISRGTVSDFLRDPVRAALLPALLSAADDAVQTERRRVLLVAHTAGEVATWVAALSYLLPPATVGRMSFATYEDDPRYGRAHVTGTVPAGADAADPTTYHLFDLVTGRGAEIVPHPLARILSGVDVADAASAWRRILRLAAGDERSFDDWLPVAAAGLTTWPQGPEAARDEPIAVAAWLGVHAARLARGDVEEIGGATLVQLTVGEAAAGRQTAAALAGLARAAGAAGAAEFLARIECRTVDLLFGAHVPVPPEMRIQTDRGRAHATRVVSDQVHQVPAAASAALLDWAAAAGIAVAEASCGQAGERIIGPALLLGPAGPEVARTLDAWPPLRAGVARYLDAVGADELDRMVAAFQDGLADRLAAELRGAGHGVRQALIVARTRSQRLDPVAALHELYGVPGGSPEPPTEHLLELLFAGRPWTAAVALRILDALGDRRAASPPIVSRLAVVVAAEPSAESWPAHLALCVRLSRSPVLPMLPEPAYRRVLEARTADAWADRLANARKERPAVLGELREWSQSLGPAGLRRAEAVLLGRFESLRAPDRGDLVRTLPGLRHAYRRMIAAELSGRDADLAQVTSVMRTLRHLDGMEKSRSARAAAAELDITLRRAIGGRGRRWQTRLIEYAGTETGSFIQRWYRQAPRGILGRLFGVPPVPDDAATERRAF